MKSYLKILNELLLILIISLFTFPKFEPDFGIGLDTSYIWGLNNLFVYHYNALINIIYPVGPLGFLRMPTIAGHNLILSIIVYSTIKTGFIIMFLRLDVLINKKRTLSSILLLLIASIFANIDLLIIASCFILNLFNLKKIDIKLFAISVLLAVVGLFIKTSIGISSFSIIFFSISITYFKYRNVTYLLKQIGVAMLVVGTFGLLIFKGNICLFMNYIYGIVKLSGGYSDTLSLHPENNWILLSSFLLLILSTPLFIKNLNFRYAFILLLFPLFASWKHALSREDTYHYFILINFLFVFGSIICISSNSKKSLILGVFAISIMLLYGNMTYLPKYKGRKIEIAGINNFVELLNFKTFKKKYADISKKNLKPNILAPKIRKMIGDKPIDIYPWEHSYVVANKLNWKMRKTLEIGASTSRWASLKASENYCLTDDSPNFVLFHLIKDKYNGYFGSLDGRYILNDEPILIFNILNNYSIVEKNNSYLLFKKNNHPNFLSINVDDYKQSEFGKWIKVKSDDNEITRLKVISKNTLLGSIKKFLYKEEIYFIDYMFDDGKILTYRYVPSTAVDGLWCNPFILNPESNIIEQKVIKVRLRNSNSSFVSNSIKIQIEHIPLNKKNNYNSINKLFLKQFPNQDSIIYTQTISFDDSLVIDHTKYELSNTYSFSGSTSNTISGGGFSYTYEYPLDSLWENLDNSIEYLQLETDVKALNTKSKANLVISISDSNEDFWLGEIINKNSEWDYNYANKILYRKKHNTGNLKIYVWNVGKEKIYIDDLRVSFKTISNKQPPTLCNY